MDGVETELAPYQKQFGTKNIFDYLSKCFFALEGEDFFFLKKNSNLFEKKNEAPSDRQTSFIKISDEHVSPAGRGQ